MNSSKNDRSSVGRMPEASSEVLETHTVELSGGLEIHFTEIDWELKIAGADLIQTLASGCGWQEDTAIAAIRDALSKKVPAAIGYAIEELMVKEMISEEDREFLDPERMKRIREILRLVRLCELGTQRK
ncbi:MAG: hypothetical protein PSV46_13900 [Reyranella sp.]|nr:hypothetical protein [Reyranella sp.]